MWYLSFWVFNIHFSPTFKTEAEAREHARLTVHVPYDIFYVEVSKS